MKKGWKKTRRYQTVKGEVKRCKQCNQLVSVQQYKKNKYLTSGLASICRVCATANHLIACRNRKQEFVDAYGGKCSCCGEKHLEFLTLEHINGDGRIHRKELQASGQVTGKAVGGKMYSWLKKHHYPKNGFTVLCWNCNCAKKYGRPCPHTDEHKIWVQQLILRARLKYD